jgi:hypothetical protein
MKKRKEEDCGTNGVGDGGGRRRRRRLLSPLPLREDEEEGRQGEVRAETFIFPRDLSSATAATAAAAADREVIVAEWWEREEDRLRHHRRVGALRRRGCRRRQLTTVRHFLRALRRITMRRGKEEGEGDGGGGIVGGRQRVGEGERGSSEAAVAASAASPVLEKGERGCNARYQPFDLWSPRGEKKGRAAAATTAASAADIPLGGRGRRAAQANPIGPILNPSASPLPPPPALYFGSSRGGVVYTTPRASALARLLLFR